MLQRLDRGEPKLLTLVIEYGSREFLEPSVLIRIPIHGLATYTDMMVTDLGVTAMIGDIAERQPKPNFKALSRKVFRRDPYDVNAGGFYVFLSSFLLR